jgi:hypothetical protein
VYEINGGLIESEALAGFHIIAVSLATGTYKPDVQEFMGGEQKNIGRERH